MLLQCEFADGEGGDVFGACLIMLVLLGQQVVLKKTNQALSCFAVLHSQTVQFTFLVIAPQAFYVVICQTDG